MSDSVAPLPPAPDVPVPPTSSSLPDYSGVSLPPVPGSTIAPPVAVRTGNATIQGTVKLNGVPVAGAVVHLDRFVGSVSSGVDVVTAADGTYRADKLVGGRYRVRGFRAPDATVDQAAVVFLGATETKSLDLTLKLYNGSTAFSSAIAPNPPVLGEFANLAVSLTRSQVDGAGTARSVGQPNVVLRLDTDGGRAIVTSNVTATDASGRAQWQLRCDSIMNQGLTLTLVDGSQQRITAPDCITPPPTTTTTFSATTTPLSP